MRLWRGALLLLLAVASGCRAPAGRFSNADARSPMPLCSLILARQIARDSAVEVTCHPVRSSMALVREPADHLWAVGRGAFGKRVMMRLAAVPPAFPRVRSRMKAETLEHDLDVELGNQRESAHVHLYTEGGDALQALLHVIDDAEEHLDVLMFQWENDALGAQLAERIAARAAANVRVRILVDGGGNLIFGIPGHPHSSDVNAVVARLAQDPHVEVVRTRNPFGRVDHRKLVLADGRRAWTGGRNFTQQSFFGYHDVSFTVEGPLALQLQDDFDQFWDEQGGRLIERVRPHRKHDVTGVPMPNALARLVHTRPLNHQIETILYRAIDRAEHHVYMENYTFCDSLLVYKLAQARQRGADVRVVLSFRDGTPALNRANRIVANRLLAAGVRVYAYPGMPHTKAAVVDGCWAYLGSGNFDPLSLRRNLEMGITISDCPLVEEVEQTVFEPDLRAEWEVKEPVPASACDYICELFAAFCL
jgi:cardiolipin synthase